MVWNIDIRCIKSTKRGCRWAGSNELKTPKEFWLRYNMYAIGIKSWHHALFPRCITYLYLFKSNIFISFLFFFAEEPTFYWLFNTTYMFLRAILHPLNFRQTTVSVRHYWMSVISLSMKTLFFQTIFSLKGRTWVTPQIVILLIEEGALVRIWNIISTKGKILYLIVKFCLLNWWC